MKKDLKQVSELLSRELDWCKAHHNNLYNESYMDGFEDGIKQCIKLVSSLSKVSKK